MSRSSINRRQFTASATIILMLAIMCLLLSSCFSNYTKNVRDQDAKISSVIMQWGYAIEKLNYQLYAKNMKYPETKETFLEEYKDYYFSGLTIVSIDYSEPKILGGESYDSVSVSVGAQSITRDGSLPEGQMHGTIELVRLSSNTELEWKIHGKMLMRN